MVTRVIIQSYWSFFVDRDFSYSKISLMNQFLVRVSCVSFWVSCCFRSGEMRFDNIDVESLAYVMTGVVLYSRCFWFRNPTGSFVMRDLIKMSIAGCTFVIYVCTEIGPLTEIGRVGTVVPAITISVRPTWNIKCQCISWYMVRVCSRVLVNSPVFYL